jgi:ATP-binding cassette subfamily B protein
MFGLYRRHPWMLAGAAALTAVANGSMPLIQWMVGQGLDAALAAGPRAVDAVAPWVVGLLVLSVARSAVAWAATVAAMALGQRILSAMRGDLFARVQALDLGFHRRHGVGELVARTTRDSDLVRDALAGGARTLVEVALVSAGAIALLWWYHWLLALVPTVLLVAACIWLARHAAVIQDLNRRTDLAYDRMTQDLEEGVRGVRVIKAFALEPARGLRFARHAGVLARRQLATAVAAAVRLPPPQMLVALSQVWVLACGAWLAARGEIGVGALAAASMVVLMVTFRVENIGRVLQVFAAARASAARLVEVLDAVPAVARGGHAALPPGPLGAELAGVRVAVGPVPILAGLDLAIAPGEVVAVVGRTGCGKSTLAALLPRLVDPQDGTVAIGGVPARDLDLDALRMAVQLVPQEAFLFSDSLAANLRLARPGATDAELAAALEDACADGVVADLPEGLAAKVGERGVSLSGGQRQRLCLARALVATPRILVADDATSALDAITERRVLANLRRRGCTTLLVASRLSTVLAADRVVMLAGGRVAGSGTHAELAATSADYRELMGIGAGVAP